LILKRASLDWLIQNDERGMTWKNCSCFSFAAEEAYLQGRGGWIIKGDTKTSISIVLLMVEGK
jgi:hypothetical protein